jgi:transcriptional regulator with XRE-family HTH domain
VDFAEKLAALMTERGIGTRALARRVPCDAALISRLAHGRQRPSAQMSRRLDEVLSAGGELAWASSTSVQTLGRSQDTAEIGSGVLSERAMRARLGAFSAVQTQELISHLNEQWHALVKADNLLGPRHALPGVI